MNAIEVPITIEADCEDIAEHSELVESIRTAVRKAAGQLGFTRGSIGVLITDDVTIHEINHKHLQHDYPTDVISFAYSADGQMIEGELVASIDTARREASELGCAVVHELLLYVIHGALHICGLGDQTDDQQSLMRTAEQSVLRSLGLPLERDLNSLSDNTLL